MTMYRLLGIAGLCCSIACRTATIGPPSLEGTAMDGHFSFDEQGAVVMDADAQRAFDYILLAEGELAPEALEDWVRHTLADEGLSDEAIEQSWEAFSAYQRYRERSSMVLTDTALSRVEARHAIEDALDAELGASPLAVRERARLDRAFQLSAALDIPEPEARRQAVWSLVSTADADNSAVRFIDGTAAIRAAQESGASPAELTRIRHEHFAVFGEEALDRLEAVAAHREDFQGRIVALAADIDSLDEDASAEQKDATVRRWIAERFSPDEQRRVRGALARHQERTNSQGLR